MAPSDANASKNINALRQLKVHLGGQYTKCAKQKEENTKSTKQFKIYRPVTICCDGKVLLF